MPSLVVFLTKSELAKEYDLSSVISVGSGAAPLSQEADAEFKERMPHVPVFRQGKVVIFVFIIDLYNSSARRQKGLSVYLKQ